MAERVFRRDLARNLSRKAGQARPGEQVLVLGLGRFGGAVAAELTRLDFEVLGVDIDPRYVQRLAPLITHTVEADVTDPDALRQLGAADVRHAVVAIGSDIEASILATAALDEVGVADIWAKAVTQPHGRILEQVGAHHVVYPEHDMGHRVAHMLGGRVMDWLQLDEQFILVETMVPESLVGKSLQDTGVRAKYGVTVVCVKPVGEAFTYATPETVLCAGDILVVAGTTKAAEAFGRLA